MNKKYLGIMAVGIAFLAIGFSNNKAFIGIGSAFILIGLIRGLTDKKRNNVDDKNEDQ